MRVGSKRSVPYKYCTDVPLTAPLRDARAWTSYSNGFPAFYERSTSSPGRDENPDYQVNRACTDERALLGATAALVCDGATRSFLGFIDYTSGDRRANIAINSMCAGNLSKFEWRNANWHGGAPQPPTTLRSSVNRTLLRHIDRNKNRAPPGRERRARDDSPCVS